jgi:hypothetical protein
VGSDVLGVVITGSTSWLAGGVAVGGVGLASRLLLWAGLLVWRTRALARHRLPWPWLALLLLALPVLAEFHLAGGRLGGDGVMYYVYTRSLFEDRDLDFTNEYTHYGLITRGDLAMPTDTGLRRSIFAVGPGLMGLPFYALGAGVARLQALLGASASLDGYGPCQRNATALGGFVYGFSALLLMHALLRRHFRAGSALLAVLLVWGATFLPWYMTQQPLMSHAPSTFMAALVLFLWERGRQRRGLMGWGGLGLAIGFAMCVRWQNGVLLVLPALDWLGQFRAHATGRGQGAAWPLSAWRALGPAAALLTAGVLLGAWPQMVAWKLIYGAWLLPHPPHGADFLRLERPFVLETLFSSRHGLLSWTPVFWAGYLGFLALARRRPQLAGPLAVPLVLMTYVNLCSGDWWAGGSYSNRRFDSLLPVFALGFAAALDWGRLLVRRQPRLALALVGLPCVAWNLALAEQARRGLIPRDDTVSFARLVGGGWQALAEHVGSPNTWPASWLFAWRHGRPAGQYDLVAGRYLFYRQNNLGGVIDVGVAGDEALLGEGWGRRDDEGGVGFRRVRARARLLVSLDVPEELELRVQARAPGSGLRAELLVNGRTAGWLASGPTWDEARVRVPAAFWRHEVNELTFVAGDAEWQVDRVTFVRTGQAR